jgi:hypothetical protein
MDKGRLELSIRPIDIDIGDAIETNQGFELLSKKVGTAVKEMYSGKAGQRLQDDLAAGLQFPIKSSLGCTLLEEDQERAHERAD